MVLKPHDEAETAGEGEYARQGAALRDGVIAKIVPPPDPQGSLNLLLYLLKAW